MFVEHFHYITLFCVCKEKMKNYMFFAVFTFQNGLGRRGADPYGFVENCFEDSSKIAV